jgi:peptidyl-Lys metalloendopeptidase
LLVNAITEALLSGYRIGGSRGAPVDRGNPTICIRLIHISEGKFSMTRTTQAVFGLSVLALSMGSAFAAPSAGSGVSVVITPSYEKSMQEVGSAIRFTMRNDSDKSLRVLKWQTPFYGLNHDLFDVAVGGAEVEYVGAWYKRGAPSKDDWMTLNAGESRSIDLDLSVAYPFQASGQYEMKFSTLVNSYDEKLASKAGAANAIESFPMTRWVDGSDQFMQSDLGSDAISFGVKALNPAPAFESCSTTRQGQLNTALNSARSYGINADNYFTAKTWSSVTARYTTWFGTSTSSRFATGKSNFDKIENALANTRITFNCSCTDSYYAYVYPTQPYRVYLCNAFWTAPNTGTDSRAGTIIHELSHFDILANTDDNAYGQTAAKRLAQTNPAKALKNADSHEYFSENTPAQN